jgi:hypothetical protein
VAAIGIVASYFGLFIHTEVSDTLLNTNKGRITLGFVFIATLILLFALNNIYMTIENSIIFELQGKIEKQ